MKEETRILLMEQIMCKEGYTLYSIIRGNKGIEHFGLVKGDYINALKYLNTLDLLDEVSVIIEGFSNALNKEFPGLKKNLPFLLKVGEETRNLICSKRVSS